MLIKPTDLTRYWNVSPSAVLHIGAHMGEEKNLYEAAGWGSIVWIEAQPKLADYLTEKFRDTSDRVICATIWHKNGISLKLNVSSNSGSSSLLEFGTHKNSYPEISFTGEIDVTSKRLDSILDEEDMPDFLNLDIQGVELQALMSLGVLINQIDYIYVEINTKEVYLGCTKLNDLDEYLQEMGFRRVITRRYVRHGWGEALYSRKSLPRKNLKSLFPRLLLALNFYRNQIRNLSKILIRSAFRGR